YGDLLRLTGLTGEALPPQWDKARWGELRARFTEVFKQKTRDEWGRIMEGSDVCFAPVLSMAEAPVHPHNRARGTFVEVDGVPQPGPAPRFSRTPGGIRRPPAAPSPGPPLQPPAGRHQPAAGGTRPAHRGGAPRLGLLRRRACRPAPGPRHRLSDTAAEDSA